MATLNELTAELLESQQDTVEYLDLSIDLQKQMTAVLTDILASIQQLVKPILTFLQDQSELTVLQLENMREQQRAREAGGAAGDVGASDIPTPTATELPDFNFGAILGTLTVGMSAYVAGILSNLTKGFNLLSKKIGLDIPKIAKSFSDGVKFIGQSLKFTFGDFVDEFVKMVKGIGTTIRESKIVSSVTNTVRTISTNVTEFFKPLTEIKTIFAAGEAGAAVAGEGGVFTKVIEGLKGIGGFLGRVLSLISRIAVPLTAIVASVKGIYDAIVDSESIWDAAVSSVTNVVKELVSAFVTFPIELIKKLISWIAGALGFENVEKALDSFNIDETFREGFDFIVKLIGDLINWVGDKVYNLLPDTLKDLMPGDNVAREARNAQREVVAAQEDVVRKREQLQRFERESGVDSREAAAAREYYQQAVERRDQAIVANEAAQSANLAPAFESAKDSGLIDIPMMGIGTDTIDQQMIANAPVEQLKAVLAYGDLSDSDRVLVQNQLDSRVSNNSTANALTNRYYSTANALTTVQPAQERAFAGVVNQASREMVAQSNVTVVNAPADNRSTNNTTIVNNRQSGGPNGSLGARSGDASFNRYGTEMFA